ncbi:MAG: ABC transporter permease [Rhodospirillaceae bacterium]
MSVFRQRLVAAIRDVRDGIASIYVWPMLGWLEIKQRYRRSTLGPFWLTLSTAVVILGMGPLYGRLFNQDLSAYFPFLAVSIVLWSLMSTLITDSCTAFISAEGYIKDLKLPYTVHVLRIVWRNLIMFAHNLIAVLVVLAIFRPHWGPSLVLVPVGVLLIAINGVWFGILLGLLCTRFRDIPQVVASLLQLAFFLTPILWRPTMLGKYQWALDLNPLYVFMEIVRAPLLGEETRVKLWLLALLITGIGWVISMLLFARFRTRIAYWL